MTSGGTEILGNVGKPRVRFSGSNFVMGFGLTGQFCVRGYSKGATNIILTWGSASATLALAGDVATGIALYGRDGTSCSQK